MLAWSLRKGTGLRRSLPESLLSFHAPLSSAPSKAATAKMLRGAISRETRARIAVSQRIDPDALEGRALTVGAICDIDRRFDKARPPTKSWSKTGTGPPLVCVPPMSRSVVTWFWTRAPPGFLQRFEKVSSKLGKTETLLAAAAAHHVSSGFPHFLRATAASHGLCRTRLDERC